MLLNKQIPIRYIFNLIKYQLLGVVIIAGTVSHYDEYFQDWGIVFPILPMSVPSLLGTMVTLVLAFRMNQSYDRWWDARKAWGSIVNDSRGLIREVVHLRSKNVEDASKSNLFKESVIKKLIAWNYGLVGSLRRIEIAEVERYLTDDELKEFARGDGNLPSGILYAMMDEIQRAYEDGIINEYQQMKMTNTINSLGDSMGKCERIKNTVFPKLYSKLIDFIIWVFVLLFPLAFRDPNKYVEFPLAMVISSIFFMLESLAKQLQDPFENRPTDTAILDIARKTEIIGQKALGRTDLPEKLKEEEFYLM